jgi:hypothetical protein
MPAWLCSGIEVDFGTYDPSQSPYPASLTTPQGITFADDDHVTGQPPTPTRIEERGRSYWFGLIRQSFVCLHCGYLLKIDLGQDFQFVDLMYCEGGGVIDGFDAQSNPVLHLEVPSASTPAVINLAPKGPMRYIEIKSSNEMFLLKICCHAWLCSGIEVDFGTYDPSISPYPGPLTTPQSITFADDDHVTGHPPTPTRIEKRGSGLQQSFVALHCGYFLKIDLGQDFQFVDLMYCEGGGVIDGFDAQSNPVLHLEVPSASTPAVINLVPKGPMSHIEIKSSNEMFLLKICCHN